MLDPCFDHSELVGTRTYSQSRQQLPGVPLVSCMGCNSEGRMFERRACLSPSLAGWLGLCIKEGVFGASYVQLELIWPF